MDKDTKDTVDKWDEQTGEIAEKLHDYKTVIEQAAMGILVIQDGVFKFVNPTLAQWAGVSTTDMLGKPFAPFVYLDDRSMVRRNHALRIRTGRGPSVYDFRIVNAKQGYMWVQLKANRIMWRGRHAILGFLMDISRLKQTEDRLHVKEAEVHEMLVGSLRALSAALEKRDPYTAGHQYRVADLCKKIGSRMGLPQDKMTAMFLAASVHDIGKIYIPAEILNRPGRLSELEFRMIRTHSQVGFEILQSIDFEYPIAEIVLQHHERIDGSGYPNGLKGNEILIEARIMAVADVVEAMSSHRPYRPALGSMEALKEIQRHRGKLFDAKIVDVCTDVFGDGYQFPPEEDKDKLLLNPK